MSLGQFALLFSLVLVILLTVGAAFSPSKLQRRMLRRALALMKKSRAAQRKDDIPRLRLSSTATRLDILTSRLLPNPEHWRRLLERSGTGWTLGTFGTIAAMVGLGTVAAALLLRFSPLVSWIAGGIAGFYLPRFLVYWAIRRRAKQFLALFPDGIGLMVRGVRSGLPVSETVITVGRELGGPVGEEFRRIAEQIQLGQPLEEVLWQAAGRIDLAEFTFMCIAFSIQRETGGNLAETLENLEQLLRRRKQMVLKIRAFSSEAKTSSAIIGSLPFVVLALLSVVNWNYVEVLFNSHAGNLLLAAAAGCLLLGVAALAKLGSFEI